MMFTKKKKKTHTFSKKTLLVDTAHMKDVYYLLR